MPCLPKLPKSRFEKTHSIVPESLIAAPSTGQLDNTEPLLREMDRGYQLANGIGAILQIVRGTTVIEDSYDENDPESEIPLSKYTTGCLLIMDNHVSKGIAEEAWKTVNWAEKLCPERRCEMTAPGKPTNNTDQDASIFEAGGICLRGARAKPFLNALHEIANAAASLD